MIEDLKVRLHTEELEKILDNRIVHHKARAEQYNAQSKILIGDETEEEANSKFANTSNNPISTLRERAKQHEKKVVYFTFLKEHLSPGDIYLLGTADLNTLEITAY